MTGLTSHITSTRKSRLATWCSGKGWCIYFSHCLALLLPVATPPNVKAHTKEPGDTSDWPEDSLNMLLEEGKRQIESQRNDLENLKSRCQFLLTIGIATLALAAATFADAKDSRITLGLWSAAILLLLVGMLGAAANLGTKDTFRIADIVVLSETRPLFPSSLVTEYCQMVKDSFDLLATRYIIYRKAVLLQILASLILLAIWIVIKTQGNTSVAV